MDFKILGISIYYIINWFFIYSFLGWVWESAYVSIKNKKLVNRGFVSGPCCTIYGFGAVSIYLILHPFEQNLLILYVGGVVVATALEFFTGWLMEFVFHTRWWDYSNNKFNVHGYICLGCSLAWGVFTLLLFKVLHPFVEWIVAFYPVVIGRAAVYVLGVLYLADFTSSAVAAFGLSKGFKHMEDLLDDMTAYIHSTKLYETTEEIRTYLDDIRPLNIAEKKYMFMKRMEDRFSASENYLEKKAELETRIDALAEKIADIKKKQNIIKKRMVHAYPDLNRHFKEYHKKLKEKYIK